MKDIILKLHLLTSISYITISHLLSVFSKILPVHYCKCCNLIGCATRYLFKMENKIWKIEMGHKWSNISSQLSILRCCFDHVKIGP